MADDDNNVEQQLWRAVLAQLLTDATIPLSNCAPAPARRDRESARHYLTTRSKDLAQVCALADIDMSRAITAFKIKVDEAKQHDNDAADAPITVGGRTKLKHNAPLFHDGRSLTVTQWAAETGLSKPAIYSRLKAGQTVEQALTKPLRRVGHRGGYKDTSDTPGPDDLSDAREHQYGFFNMITLADLKDHLRIIGTEDDSVLVKKLAAASQWVSLYTAIPIPDYPVDDGAGAPVPYAPNVPAPVKEAVRLLAGHLFENREASLVGVVAQSLPFGVLDMLNGYRAWVFRWLSTLVYACRRPFGTV
jgi:hypothetical protein